MFSVYTYAKCTNYTKCIQMLIESYTLLCMMQLLMYVFCTYLRWTFQIYVFIGIQTQKYTSSRYSKQMQLSIFKLRSILEVDFLYLCIYYVCSNSEVYRKQIFQMDVISFQTQKCGQLYIYLKQTFYKLIVMYLQVDLSSKYTGSRFSNLMSFFSFLEVYLKQTFNPGIDSWIQELGQLGYPRKLSS